MINHNNNDNNNNSSNIRIIALLVKKKRPRRQMEKIPPKEHVLHCGASAGDQHGLDHFVVKQVVSALSSLSGIISVCRQLHQKVLQRQQQS